MDGCGARLEKEGKFPKLIERLTDFTGKLFAPPHMSERGLTITTGGQAALQTILHTFVDPGDHLETTEAKPVMVGRDHYGLKPELLRDKLKRSCSGRRKVQHRGKGTKGRFTPETTHTTHEARSWAKDNINNSSSSTSSSFSSSSTYVKNCQVNHPPPQRISRLASRPLLYLIPNADNPTGNTLSHERRQEIYDIACTYDILIIEDDPYFFLQYGPQIPPSFLSLDTAGRVLRIDSFSKIIGPGLRLGYITADKPFIDTITNFVSSFTIHSSSLSQERGGEL
ncbi:Kynurenine/alpha-aminoadipate aminotransferase, mitochondrial [Portunus trituberculatus]|uniref:Kynurenine/alpha-aminoadipate aminotransferase, mitochondrial n=1 Tax=Portunus trituberculatus TaxID=210409 RepID=A0A5B7CIF1_PORTR|nr:Kynurenine/alpha-aminoadipate aminotransferase, mitochondrial [Portunus trituberculatus]